MISSPLHHTLGICELAVLVSKIIDKIVVMHREIRAGTALDEIHREHHDINVKMVAGAKTVMMKNSNRRLNEKVANNVEKVPEIQAIALDYYWTDRDSEIDGRRVWCRG